MSMFEWIQAGFDVIVLAFVVSVANRVGRLEDKQGRYRLRDF